MKNKISLFLLSALLLSACDKIEHPVIEQISTGIDGLDYSLFPGDPGSYIVPEFTPSSNAMRNVLLEDYTGHKCTNCPSASQNAANLAANNPGRVFVAAIHASTSGNFQALDAEHPTDFTTSAGDAYATDMPGFFGNPSGTINRRSMGISESVWYLDFQWQSELALELQEPNAINLQVATNYYPETNGLFIHIDTELKSALNENHRLVIYLIRDLVISAQSLNDGTVDEEYEQEHVLSANINGTWGTALRLDTLALNESVQYHYSYALPDPNVDPTYASANLKLLVYVIDRETYRVVQVIEKHI